MLITYKDLAKIKGVSPPAVTKKMKKEHMQVCKVTHNGQTLVNSEMALALWDKTTSIARKPTVSSHIKENVKSELKKEVNKMEADEIPDFNVSRSKKEYFHAKLAEIDVGVKKKELIDAKLVEKKSFEIAVSIREALLTLPDRVSSLFASETDSTVIDKTLREEILFILEKLGK